VKIESSDYLLMRFASRNPSILRWLGNRETAFLRSELSSIPIEKPVFITGLARAGTTIFLELFSTVDGVATHRYRDFPLLTVPYFWNRYLDLMPVRQEPVERAHQDRIQITRESPEAFEEPIWMSFFPDAHSPTALHRLDDTVENPAFERFFQDHLRKLIRIRQGDRYLSKGNYNVSRIEYLARLFPDARFIVAIRHPLTHVHSLVRQHRLFSDYAAADARVPRYLAAAGHFEFGSHRVPIRFDAAQGDRILEAWSRGDDYLGYAIQWAEIYGFVNALRQSAPEVADRIHVVRYEDFCDDPTTIANAVLEHIDVDPNRAKKVFEQLGRISQSTHRPDIDSSTQTSLLAEVEPVARAFGYELDTN
jgi:hypothetical protein